MYLYKTSHIFKKRFFLNLRFFIVLQNNSYKYPYLLIYLLFVIWRISTRIIWYNRVFLLYHFIFIPFYLKHIVPHIYVHSIWSYMNFYVSLKKDYMYAKLLFKNYSGNTVHSNTGKHDIGLLSFPTNSNKTNSKYYYYYY